MVSIFADELINKQILKRLNREVKRAQMMRAIEGMNNCIKDMQKVRSNVNSTAFMSSEKVNAGNI